MYTQRYWNEQLFDAIDRMNALAGDAGIPLVEAALRWVAYRPGVTSILLGGSRESQVSANIETIRRGPLPADLVQALDDVGSGLRGPMPAYNR
ncbi:hypothetical protein GCM10025867_42590 [Frondihabitans sucicola]|uniref:NADP-dependent oxidoreductase domain-containing protein n=1 Tax=Frondihabitans sucicola TaxID=1268041 RepID=A0ABM8GUB0_9MICO|nr:hypothetical protein GCM10025867_42590 [Frondihabitans sucicola]